MTTYRGQPYEIVPWDLTPGDGTYQFPTPPGQGMLAGVKKISNDFNQLTIETTDGKNFEAPQPYSEFVAATLIWQPGELLVWSYDEGADGGAGAWLLWNAVKRPSMLDVFNGDAIAAVPDPPGVPITWSPQVIQGLGPYFFDLSGGTDRITCIRHFTGKLGWQLLNDYDIEKKDEPLTWRLMASGTFNVFGVNGMAGRGESVIDDEQYFDTTYAQGLAVATPGQYLQLTMEKTRVAGGNADMSLTALQLQFTSIMG